MACKAPKGVNQTCLVFRGVHSKYDVLGISTFARPAAVSTNEDEIVM